MRIVSGEPTGPTPSAPRRDPAARYAWSTWLAPLIVAIALLPTLAIPFERDEGEYLWAADLVRRGLLPYRDTFLQKPPAIVLAYAAIQSLVGDTPAAIHAVLLCVYAATAILVAGVARRVGGDRAGLVAAFVFALVLTMPTYQATAFNTEALVILGTAASTLALVRLVDDRLARWVGVAGAAASLALFAKPVAAPHALLVLVAVWLLGRSRRERVRWAGMIAALVAAPYLVALAYFAARGALYPFIDGVLLHNIEYSRHSLEREYLLTQRRSLIPLTRLGLLLAAASAVGLLTLVRRRERALAWILGVGTLAAWAGVSAGSVYRGHYFLLLLPFVAALCGIASARLQRSAVAAASIVALAAWMRDGGSPFGKSATALHLARYGDPLSLNAAALGRWLHARGASGGDSTLYVLASEPEIYHLADAVPVTRYVIQDPLFGGYPSSHARQAEVWRAVSARPPRFLVTTAPGASLAVPRFPASDPWLVQRVDSLVAADYDLIAVTGPHPTGVMSPTAPSVPIAQRVLLVYERRDATHTVAARPRRCRARPASWRRSDGERRMDHPRAGICPPGRTA